MSKNDEIKPSEKQISSLLQFYNNGDNTNAEKLAVLLTQNFPNHNLGWKVLASLYKAQGDLSRSLEANQKSIEINPLDAEAYNNLANSMLALNDEKEAEKYYKKAIEINPRNEQMHSNLGKLFVSQDRFDEAELSYKESINLNSDNAPTFALLGEMLEHVGRTNEAEENFKKAIAIDPKHPDYHVSLGLVERIYGRVKDADASYRKALVLDPKNTHAHYNLGIMLFEKGQYKEAASHFNLTNQAHSKSFELKCYYLQGEQLKFYEKLDKLIKEGKIDAVIGSLSCRSEIRYGIKKTNPFCNDPLKYLLKADLTERYDFKNIFIEEVKNILNEDGLSTKSQSLITNGYQTSGNLFKRETAAIKKIKDIIHLEINSYRSFYKNSNEGFITKWPEKYSLHGWIISLKNGGQLSSHMHDNGWLSGSIYINIPKKSKSDSGNLVVRIDDEKYPIKGNNQSESIDIVTGSMCLFPSSLLHHTIPFESEEERIVLAFDVLKPN